MNSTQKRILGRLTSIAAHANKHEWWELKRQVWDGGYQPYYPMQSNFEDRADRLVRRLSDVDKQELVADWRKKNPDQNERSDEYVLAICSAIVVEEIVRRAAIAAYRTVNW